MVHLQALCSHLFMNADGAQGYSIMGCASLHGFLLYLKQSAYFCSSRLRRSFKKLMASLWAINMRASYSQMHVFLLMRFNQKDACANKPVYYCSRLYMPVFHCMGRCLLCMEQMELNWISTEMDVCYVLCTEEMSFFHQTFDIVGWCCWCLKNGFIQLLLQLS